METYQVCGKWSKKLPVTKINRTEDGEQINYDLEERVKMVFREECRKRFTLARGALIMDTELEHLGTITEENIFEAEKLASGNLEIPGDMDMTSKIILEEIILMGKDIVLTNEEKSAVTSKEFCQF